MNRQRFNIEDKKGYTGLVFFGIIILLYLTSVTILILHSKINLTESLEVGKLLFSWPIVISFLISLTFLMFNDEIKFLISNVFVRLKLPGGGSAEFSIQDRPPFTEELREEIIKYVQNSNAEIEILKSDRDVLLKQYDELFKEKIYFELSYLNHFLVQSTKKVLIWFNLGPWSYRAYDQAWHFIHKEQREIIFKLLKDYELIVEVQKELYNITQKGFIFIKYFASFEDESASTEEPEPRTDSELK